MPVSCYQIQLSSKRRNWVLDFIKFFSPSLRQLGVPVAALLLTAGVSAAAAKSVQQLEPEAETTSKVAFVHSQAIGEDAAKASKGDFPKKDGIYLYGQSPEPEQLGQEYIIFEVQNGNVIGALYMPQSEFSCFDGKIESGKLAMIVAGYPDGGDGPTEVAAVGNPAIGFGDELITYPFSVSLENYHQLGSVNANDQRILETCKANY